MTKVANNMLSDFGVANEFELNGEHVDAQFFRGDQTLYITFDNLGTVGQFDKPRPWMKRIIQEQGFSILGLIAKRKDWYRNGDPKSQLELLQSHGFFDQFDRVIFAGASMGGYAALTYSRLVPGSEVLAFSPQTTLNRELAPFEKRYRYGFRRWDWDTAEFLDAAEAVQSAAKIRVLYDPFITEDKRHADRLIGDNVNFLRCRHFGHKLIRLIKECGALSQLVGSVGRGEFDEVHFYATLRSRRGVRKWRKSILKRLEERGQGQLALVAVDNFLVTEPAAKYLTAARNGFVELTTTDIAARSRKTEFLVFPAGEETKLFRGVIEQIDAALILPERESDKKLATGVLYSDGQFCELSTAWIRLHKRTQPPTLGVSEECNFLAGSYLFAGHIRNHFGHFLVESTARLWGAAHLGNQIDGVVYHPYGTTNSKAKAFGAVGQYQEFFEILGLSERVQVVTAPTRVERLYVPELGFGWGERYAGSAQYRYYFQKMFSAAVQAEGGKRLYISRSGLGLQKGGILGEDVIEENLAKQGYEIFRPEKHSLREQLARYKSADYIVALDGSALHLAAFMLKPGGRVGIILRRSRANIADYALQFRSFCSIEVDPIDAIRFDWVSGPANRADYRSIGELDFPLLFHKLAELGFVELNFVPDLPTSEEVREGLSAYSGGRQIALRPLPKHSD